VLIFPSNEDLQKEKELALKATFLPIFQGKTKQNKTINQTEEGASTHRDDWYGSADLPNRIESIMRKNSPWPPTCKSSTMATKYPSFAFLLYNAREGVCIRFRWRPLRQIASLHWRNLKSENPSSPSGGERTTSATPPCPKFSPPAHPVLFTPRFYPAYSANNLKI
jgi:hypothetical protein